LPKSDDDEDEKMEEDDRDEEAEEDSNEENGEAGDKSAEDLLVSFGVKILQVGDSDKHCVEFHNIEGDKLVFYQVIQKLRDDLADLANATA